MEVVIWDSHTIGGLAGFHDRVGRQPRAATADGHARRTDAPKLQACSYVRRIARSQVACAGPSNRARKAQQRATMTNGHWAGRLTAGAQPRRPARSIVTHSGTSSARVDVGW